MASVGGTERNRILLVDDSALLLESAKAALEGAGYDVTTAQDMGQLQNITDNVPDLILMDVQMPELFGDDVAMVLRDVRGVASRIYLFSSLDEDDLRERAADAGLDGYIWKGVGLEELVERVNGILADEAGGH